jgi:archaellum component FlaG (FlaF/FlaG flagellin family)
MAMSTERYSVINDPDNPNNIEGNTQTLLKSYKNIGLEIKPEANKYF